MSCDVRYFSIPLKRMSKDELFVSCVRKSSLVSLSVLNSSSFPIRSTVSEIINDILQALTTNKFV
jgi:hypothetical protein